MAKKKHHKKKSTQKKHKPTGMAHTKKKRSHKKKGTHHKKTTSHRRRGMLSEAFSKMQFQTTVKQMGGGTLAGVAVLGAEKAGIDNLKPIAKGGLMYGGSFVAGIMGKPGLCGGLSAVATYKLAKESGSLSEPNPKMAKYTKELMQLPEYLSEDNTPMQLAQGEYMLSEAVSNMALSENNYAPFSLQR